MITIRRIQLGEAALFKKIRLESLRDAPYAFSSTYEAAIQRSAESWEEQANSTSQGADRATFLFFSEKTPLGIAAIYRLAHPTDTGEVIQVWVDPDYRGKGLAKDLIEFIIQWANENGFHKILVTIRKENPGALAFYRKCGFQVSLDSGDSFVLSREIDRTNQTG
jgi:ribosomal protein S18 acetylase RimI-like enzyme